MSARISQNLKLRLKFGFLLTPYFCTLLQNELGKLDIEIQWSPMNFTPLDAEVEIRSEDRRVKKITDLLTAIKKAPQTDKTFLVLG